MTTTYYLDPNLAVDIPTKEDFKEVEPINYNINCHTDGSKRDDNRTGAGVFINYSHNDIAEESIHLGNNATVFQAKVFAVGRKTNRFSHNLELPAQFCTISSIKTNNLSKTGFNLDTFVSLNNWGEI